jgi:hypothetical protein
LKTYEINIRPTAEQDIRNRYEQITSESPENAKHWYTDLINAIRSLEHLALRCPIAEEDSEFKLGIRQLVVGRYRVIDLTTDTSVEVLHVRHSRHARRL